MKGSVTQLPSGRWKVRYYTADGRRPSGGTFRTKKAAEDELKRILDDLDRGVQRIDRTSTLSDFLPEWAAATKVAVKPRTWEVYEAHARLHIEPVLGGVRIALIDARTVQRFVDQLTSRELSPKSVRGVHGTLSLVLGMAASYGLVRRLERGQTRLPRVERQELRVPTVAEVEELADAIDPRCWALILLAGYCGLRQGELIALHPADVDWLRRRIRVHRSTEKTTRRRVAETKSGRGRMVTLPTRVADALSQHVAEYPDPEHVFHRSGEPMHASWLTHPWQAARKAVDVEDVRFHDLRHAAASLMIQSGWSAKRVQVELGHADPAFTLRVYGHLWPDELDQGRAALDAVIDAARASARTPYGPRGLKTSEGTA